ncbi:hypothetical protein CRG98_029905 [Punica granatum]|uniref:Fe(2+) transport protein 1-like n=1 Tax=Punica granatum TaxID=22663 RepID=A0A2I0J147_PUNGR|nr:hypothetical protein CRG98_029905 [Punica granatum]
MLALLSSGHHRGVGIQSRATATALLLLLLVLTLGVVSANEQNQAQLNCGEDDSPKGQCRNGPEALKLKLIAIASILATSVLGVCLPVFSRSVPALHPDSNIFVVVKAFASGVILATGYMHVLPDSFEFLTSDCLPEVPWSKFPFTTFVAMLSAVATQMVDSFAMAYYRKIHAKPSTGSHGKGAVKDVVAVEGGEVHAHAHGGFGQDLGDDNSRLLRHRVVAQSYPNLSIL